MTGALNLPENYWNEIQVTPTDVENLHTTLFERETPLTTHDLAFAFIEARVRAEQAIKESEKKNSAKKFLPKEKYTSGDDLVFPALGWRAGKVKTVRSGLSTQRRTTTGGSARRVSGTSRRGSSGVWCPLATRNDVVKLPAVERAIVEPSKVRDEAVATEASRYGQKYAVRGSLEGPTGRTAVVVAVCIVLRGEDFPRFVTAFPGSRS
jgi:hypothetical protein